jgi:hypothetical protein
MSSIRRTVALTLEILAFERALDAAVKDCIIGLASTQHMFYPSNGK